MKVFVNADNPPALLRNGQRPAQRRAQRPTRPHKDVLQRSNGDDVEMWEDDVFYSMPEMTATASGSEPKLNRLNVHDLEDSQCHVSRVNSSLQDVPEASGQGVTRTHLQRYGNGGRRVYYNFPNLQTPAVGRHHLRLEIYVPTPVLERTTTG